MKGLILHGYSARPKSRGFNATAVTFRPGGVCCTRGLLFAITQRLQSQTALMLLQMNVVPLQDRCFLWEFKKKTPFLTGSYLRQDGAHTSEIYVLLYVLSFHISAHVRKFCLLRVP